MDRQSVSLIVLCVLLLIFWEPIFDLIWPPSKPPAGTFTNRVAAATSPIMPAAAVTSSNTLLSLAGPPSSRKSEEMFLENDKIKAVFTQWGGGIDHVILKKYPEGNASATLNSQSPLPALSVAMGDVSFRAPCRLTSESNRLLAQPVASQSLLISREYKLKKDYLIGVSIEMKNNSAMILTNQTFHLALGMAGPMNAMDSGDYTGISFLSGEKATHELAAALLKKPFDSQQPIQWAAICNQYFALVVTPSLPFAGIRAESVALPPNDDPQSVKQQHGALAAAISTPFDLKAGASTNWTFEVYAGPKDYQRLEQLGLKQDEVMNFGMWGIFCKPLLWTLKHLHGFFGNWGMAIVGVTVAIKILFWPLTAISTRSMKQMQALAPKMSALKEKYPNDQKKQSEEMMKIYREYRINPMAGCLPMVVQIPIFFAFYTMLQTAVELRGAHFLWIMDLSRPDTVARILNNPINPMPLIMACTMIWQTKITPQAPNADPSMKLMIWLMPVMFLYFCYNFSSGLSLYWTAQNLLTVLQTYLTRNQKIEPPQKVKSSGGLSFSRPLDSRKK